MRSHSSSNLPSPFAAAILLGAVLFANAGCQSYEEKPLDLAATREALAARSPASEEVAAYAKRLAATDTGAVPQDFSPSDGLSLPEAEVVALVYNPQLRIRRLEAGVAKATADTAGIWEDPVTGFNLNDVLQNNGSITMGAQFSLTIPISGRLEAEKKRAGAAFEARLAEVQAEEWQTRVELRNAWARWSTDRERLAVVEETSEAIGSLIALVDRMEKIGEMPRIESRLFRIEHATLLAEMARLRAALRTDEIAIKRIMGIAAWNEAALTPALPPSAPDESIEALRDAMLERSPTIHALRARYEVAERALATEVRKQYPDLEIGPSYNTDGNEDFVFGVQFPLPLWNHNQQGVAKAFAEREVSRAHFETTVELHLSDLESAAVELESAVEQRKLLETTLVTMVDTQAEDTARIAQLGEVNTLIQLDTLTRRQNAKLALIDARRNEWLALLRMALLIGPAAPVPPERTDSIEPASSPPSPRTDPAVGLP